MTKQNVLSSNMDLRGLVANQELHITCFNMNTVHMYVNEIHSHTFLLESTLPDRTLKLPGGFLSSLVEFLSNS